MLEIPISAHLSHTQLQDQAQDQAQETKTKTKTTEHRYHLRDLLTSDLNGFPIKVADHCYGCTAGQGSSCGGALDD